MLSNKVTMNNEENIPKANMDFTPSTIPLNSRNGNSEMLLTFATNQKDAKGFYLTRSDEPPSPPAIPQSDIFVDHTIYEKEIFEERNHLLCEKTEYPRDGKEPGLVVIFNHENFVDKTLYPPRFGSRRDVNEIILCLGRFGYNIKKDYIFNDCTRDQLIANIDKISQKDFTEYNSLIVFFMSHGESFDSLRTYDYALNAHELWTKFAKCETLRNKPKLFFIQACKGESHSKITGDEHNDTPLVSESTFQPKYLSPDMLVVYSTTEGNVSFRNSLTGTWFIQELCKNFYFYGRRDDILTLLIRITKCVCRNYYHQVNDNDFCKQIPVFVSTLTKRFFLNRNRDRDIVLDVVKKYENLQQIVQNLAQKVDEIYQHFEGKQ